LTDGEQYVEISQLYAATDLMFAIEFITHACMLPKRGTNCNL